MTDQSYAGSVGIFSRRTNRTQEAWVYSHDGPIIPGDAEEHFLECGAAEAVAGDAELGRRTVQGAQQTGKRGRLIGRQQKAHLYVRPIKRQSCERT
eukprot:2958163-Pyramimonas_sp.AAC.1